MTAQKHTPGPWFANQQSARAFDGRIPIVGGNTQLVALTTRVHQHFANAQGDAETQEANARLIACAPAMLATLRRVMNMIDNGVMRETGWEEMSLEAKAVSLQQSIVDQITTILKEAYND